MRLFKHIQEYQRLLIFNCFMVAISNSIFHSCLQEYWDADMFLWIYFIITILSVLLRAYSDMKYED